MDKEYFNQKINPELEQEHTEARISTLEQELKNLEEKTLPRLQQSKNRAVKAVSTDPLDPFVRARMRREAEQQLQYAQEQYAQNMEEYSGNVATFRQAVFEENRYNLSIEGIEAVRRALANPTDIRHVWFVPLDRIIKIEEDRNNRQVSITVSTGNNLSAPSVTHYYLY